MQLRWGVLVLMAFLIASIIGYIIITYLYFSKLGPIKFLVREFLICLFVLSWLLIGVFTILDILGFTFYLRPY